MFTGVGQTSSCKSSRINIALSPADFPSFSARVRRLPASVMSRWVTLRAVIDWPPRLPYLRVYPVSKLLFNLSYRKLLKSWGPSGAINPMLTAVCHHPDRPADLRQWPASEELRISRLCRLPPCLKPCRPERLLDKAAVLRKPI